MKHKTFWGLLSTSVLLILSTNVVFACKCASGLPQEYYFNAAEYVALVKVNSTELRPSEELSKDAQGILEGTGFVSQYIRISFDEQEVFKGMDNKPDYLMEWIRGGGNCALGLLPGLEYVVFLRKDSMGFVRDCTGTRGYFEETDDNGEDVRLKLLRDLAEKQGRKAR